MMFSPRHVNKLRIRAATDHLRVAVLDQKPVYEALSYTWGDPDVTDTIRVDGVEVDVTVNLKDALR